MLLNRPVAVDAYKDNRLTGSFIVIDRVTQSVGAGMILNVYVREAEMINRFAT